MLTPLYHLWTEDRFFGQPDNALKISSLSFYASTLHFARCFHLSCSKFFMNGIFPQKILVSWSHIICIGFGKISSITLELIENCVAYLVRLWLYYFILVWFQEVLLLFHVFARVCWWWEFTLMTRGVHWSKLRWQLMSLPCCSCKFVHLKLCLFTVVQGRGCPEEQK